MKYTKCQKDFIKYMCKYKSYIQGYLFKNILQDFLRVEDKYGIKITNNEAKILINNNKKYNEYTINEYISEIYSIVYLICELVDKELIFYSEQNIDEDFNFSITNFKNDEEENIFIKKEKIKLFLQIINSHIFITSELRSLLKNKFETTEGKNLKYTLWALVTSVLLGMCSCSLSYYDIFHNKEKNINTINIKFINSK